MYGIQIKQYGGPEVMEYIELPQPTPKEGEALVRLTAIGVNYIDVYNRSGHYQLPLPLTPGQEGAGVVEAVGAGVTEVKIGDRVAYSSVIGSYAQYTVVPAQRLVIIPDGVDHKSAAAAMLQGMTAHYLVNTTYPIQPGDTALVHAGAGGAGLLLTQLIKQRGARVITTVSSEEKAQLSREAGADEVINYAQVDFASEVRRLTEGKGVAVVYDGVGKTTWEGSLDSLRPRGYMVSYGSASGAVPAFPLTELNRRGSLFVTRPSLHHYTANRTELLERAGDILNLIGQGKLKLRIEHTYPLKEAAQAHRELEGRATTGKLLLLPE